MKTTRGFTLLEVLIALSLLLLVLVAVVASMRTLGNTRATLDQVIGRVDEIRSVSGFLRNSIGGALPLQLPETNPLATFEAGQQGNWFGGDATQLHWVSPVLSGARFGGAYAMQLRHESESLILRWHPYRMDYAEQSRLPDQVLLRDVEEFEIGYLPHYGEQWQDEWPAGDVNPAAVRLNIRANGRYWPELVIAINGVRGL